MSMSDQRDEHGLAYQTSPWGNGYNTSIPIPTKLPLTAEELETLLQGTPILVLWGGGNGPHWYALGIDQYGDRYARSADEVQRSRWDYEGKLLGNPMTTLGEARWNTKVWTEEAICWKPSQAALDEWGRDCQAFAHLFATQPRVREMLGYD
jgi:hypothetical protein